MVFEDYTYDSMRPPRWNSLSRGIGHYDHGGKMDRCLWKLRKCLNEVRSHPLLTIYATESLL